MKKILALCAVIVPFAFAACGTLGEQEEMKQMSMEDASAVTIDVTGMT